MLRTVGLVRTWVRENIDNYYVPDLLSTDLVSTQ